MWYDDEWLCTHHCKVTSCHVTYVSTWLPCNIARVYTLGHNYQHGSHVMSYINMALMWCHISTWLSCDVICQHGCHVTILQVSQWSYSIHMIVMWHNNHMVVMLPMWLSLGHSLLFPPKSSMNFKLMIVVIWQNFPINPEGRPSDHH